MKNLLNSSAILLVAVNAVNAIDSHQHQSFKNWKEEHGIIYDTYQEHIYREQIYLDNIEKISKLNNDNDDTAFYAINKFADMSTDEFHTKILLPTTNTTNMRRLNELSFGEVKESSASIVTHHHPHYNSTSTNTDTDNDIPDTIDWRDKGAVTKVKDQGNLGTCWAFSTVGNIESQLFLKHGKLIDLSVEQLLECDSISSMDKADCGMFGGWPELAYQYLLSSGGLFSDQDWPYCSQFPSKSPDHCFPCMANSYSKENCGDHSDLYCDPETTLGQRSKNPQCTNINIKKGKTVSLSKWSKISEDENEIAKSLATIGPLSILINASKLQFYKGGIVNSKFCNPDALNHAVLLVGYDVDAWIIKNSWSEKWGENGYVRLARGDGTCGLNKAVTTSYVQ